MLDKFNDVGSVEDEHKYIQCIGSISIEFLSRSSNKHFYIKITLEVSMEFRTSLQYMSNYWTQEWLIIAHYTISISCISRLSSN